jgi:hypothetical protein
MMVGGAGSNNDVLPPGGGGYSGLPGVSEQLIRQDEVQWNFLKDTIAEYFDEADAAQKLNYLEQKMRVAATTFKKPLLYCRLDLFDWLRFDLPDRSVSSMKRRFAWAVAHAIREPWFLGSVMPSFARRILVHQFRHTQKPVFIIRLSYTVRPWLVLESVSTGAAASSPTPASPHRAAAVPAPSSSTPGLNVCKTLVKYAPSPNTPTGLLFWLDTVNGELSASSSIYDLVAYVEQKTGWQPFAKDFYNQDELPTDTRASETRSSFVDPYSFTRATVSRSTVQDLQGLEDLDSSVLPLDSNPEVASFMAEHWGVHTGTASPASQPAALLPPSPAHPLDAAHPFDIASPQFTQLSQYYL